MIMNKPTCCRHPAGRQRTVAGASVPHGRDVTPSDIFCTAGHMRPSFLMVTTCGRVCSKPNCRDVKTQIFVGTQNQRAGGILPGTQHIVSVVWARAPYQKAAWWNTPSTRTVPNQRTGAPEIKGSASSPIARGSDRIWSSKVG